MKQILILLTIILFISCSDKSKILTENGSINGGIYTCNKFDWKIDIPEGYTIRNLKQSEDLEEVGYNSLKKETPDGILIQKKPLHLIGFGIDENNYFSSSVESLKGTKRMKLSEHKKIVSKLISNTYDNIEGVEYENEESFEKIGKYYFYKIQFKLYNQKTSELLLTQIIYNAYIEDNLFGVSINFTKEEVKNVLVNNFINSITN